jgi:hypothetical protein
VLLAVYADSVRRRRTGVPVTWKGRSYRNDPGTVRWQAARPPADRTHPRGE